jgi:hypothetical protein
LIDPKLVLFVVALLGLPQSAITPHMYTDADIDDLARIIQGEAVHLVTDKERAGIAVAHTALNVPGEWSLGYMARHRFHGYVENAPVEPWARLVAEAAVAIQPYEDHARGCYYMLSRHDLVDYGILEKEKDAIYAFTDEFGYWGLYGFCEWPIEGP